MVWLSDEAGRGYGAGAARDRKATAITMNGGKSDRDSWTHPPGVAAETAARQQRAEEAFKLAVRHSRRVRLLKILLPAFVGVAALVLIGYSFIGLPRGVSIDLGGTALRDGRIVMANPELDGFTAENRPYTMRAERASQELGNTSVIDLEGIGARLPLDEEGWADLNAGTGRFDQNANTLELGDGITVRLDRGVTAVLRSARVDLTEGSMSTVEPVRVELEGSEISADSLQVTDRGSVLIFENRVRMQINGHGLGAATPSEENSDAD